MILITGCVPRPLRLALIMALISRLLVADLGPLARGRSHAFWIRLVPVGGPRAGRIGPLLCLSVWHLQLLLAPSCLVLFVHEIYIVFFLVIESRLNLLLAA